MCFESHVYKFTELSRDHTLTYPKLRLFFLDLETRRNLRLKLIDCKKGQKLPWGLKNQNVKKCHYLNLIDDVSSVGVILQGFWEIKNRFAVVNVTSS